MSGTPFAHERKPHRFLRLLSYLQPDEQFWAQLLTKRFDVDLCDQPDFLIYGTSDHETAGGDNLGNQKSPTGPL
jgi:hypothetical protein